MTMQTDTNPATLAPARPRGGSLPAGAGVALAMILGGVFWVGVVALLM